MTNIELVIKIPKEIYESSKRECEETDDLIIDTFTLAIGNGTPLPKGHGKLIDADALDIDNLDRAYDDDFELDLGRLYTADVISMIDNAHPIIEADKAESEDKE